MKLVSWNVNGVRSCWNKGLADYLKLENADVVCLQETKIQDDKLTNDIRNPFKYNSFWSCADKNGYSGVGTYSKTEPESFRNGIGVPEFDSEGRVHTLEFKDFYLVNAYFPNSRRDHSRLPYKLEFCAAIKKYLDKLKKSKHVIICGDFNIAHKEIDLKNPKTNKDNAGFLPEERAWMDRFLSSGYTDTFRMFESGGDHYTWWSYRPGIRKRNIGWRIDYHCIDDGFKPAVKKSVIRSEIMGSDHCPILLEVAP